MRKFKKMRCKYHYSYEGKFSLAIRSVDFVRVYKDECENWVQMDYGWFFQVWYIQWFHTYRNRMLSCREQWFHMKTNGFKSSKTRNPNFEYTRWSNFPACGCISKCRVHWADVILFQMHLNEIQIELMW